MEPLSDAAFARLAGQWVGLGQRCGWKTGSGFAGVAWDWDWSLSSTPCVSLTLDLDLPHPRTPPDSAALERPPQDSDATGEGAIDAAAPVERESRSPPVLHATYQIVRHPVRAVPVLCFDGRNVEDDGTPLAMETLLSRSLDLLSATGEQQLAVMEVDDALQSSTGLRFMVDPVQAADMTGKQLRETEGWNDPAMSLLVWFSVCGRAVGLELHSSFLRRATMIVPSPALARGPYIILCAEEHHKLPSGSRYPGLHCSLCHIGRAYDQLVDRVGRERLIIIGCVDVAVSWMRRAVDRGLPLFAPSMSVEESKLHWRKQMVEVLGPCTRLIADGGTDYDGPFCNPATLAGIMTGDCALTVGRVIPRGEGSSVLVGLYSHGWSHSHIRHEAGETGAEVMDLGSRFTCDLCGHPHLTEFDWKACDTHSSLQTREWFMHCTHETPPHLRETLRYADMHTEGHPHPYSLFYARQLIRCCGEMFEAAPTRPVVVLANFCGSGGWGKYLTEGDGVPPSWPLCLMTSCGELEGAVGGSLLPLFISNLVALREMGKTLSLAEMLERVTVQYRREDRSLQRTFSEHVEGKELCLICRQFCGMKRQKWLCSVCFKAWSAKSEAEREDLSKLKLARATSRRTGTGACVLRMCCHHPSLVNEFQAVRLLGD